MEPMSKRLVVRALQRQGCRKISELGPHEKWMCPCGRHSTSVPRHGEVSPGVVRKIQRHLACLEEGWLQ